MSARRSIYVRRFASANGGETPNAYRPEITAEIRLFYPPNNDNLDLVEYQLDQIYHEALGEIARQREAGET